MANDLISRKALMQEIEKSMNNNPHTEPKVKVNHEQEHKHFMCLLSKQPTAYNVEKVVEGLEEIKGQGCVGVKCKDCKYTHNCFEGERAENVVIDKAIEIIRRGGVE